MSDNAVKGGGGLLKAAEAGQLLGVSARTMYALAKAGKIACHRLGVGDGAVRFDPAAVESYKQACRSPATNAPVPLLPAPVPAPVLLQPVVLPKPTASELRKQRRELEAQRREARRALVLFHANKRRAAKLNRTPAWSDLDAMRAIYADAQRLTAETGIQHHVDHIIPLQGKLVSGLHVHNNLQILTGTENSKKRNRFEIQE